MSQNKTSGHLVQILCLDWDLTSLELESCLKKVFKKKGEDYVSIPQYTIEGEGQVQICIQGTLYTKDKFFDCWSPVKMG